MKIFTLTLFFSITLMLFTAPGCDADSDAQYPQIDVVLPAEGSVYNSGDTIRFKAVFSDNIKPAQIEITLVDNENKPVLPTIGVIADTNPFTFEGEYPIDDPLLPDALYFLRFRVSDGTNTTNRFVKIKINELPLTFLYPLIVTHQAQNLFTAFRLNDAGSWSEILSYTGDYCGSAVNSTASQLHVCGIYQSNLKTVKLPDGKPQWEVQPGLHQSERWFESIQFSFPNLYVCCTEGNVRGYKSTGNEIYKSETLPDAFPYLSVTSKDLILGAFRDVFSTNKYLVAFHNEGGKMVYNRFIVGDIIGMQITTANKVLVLSNRSGQGEISVFNGADFTYVPMKTFTNGIFSKTAKLDSDHFLVSTNSGLYRYQLSTNALSLFVPSLNNSLIACDITSDRIYISSGKILEVYSFPDASLLETITLPDTVIDLHLVYNK